MTDLAALKAENAKRFAQGKITRRADFVFAAKRLVAPGAKQRYQFVEAKTGVPWAVVAVIHERESDQDWKKSLAQGDRWDEVSKHVPAGRGPFLCWEQAAVDALVMCAPHAAKWKDWSIGGALCLLEQYNGLGYANHGVPSPYIWSGTDQYTRGKIRVDHGPIEPEVDVQLGCAGLLMAMMALDTSISFGKPTATILPMPKPIDVPDVHKPEPVPQPVPQPAPTHAPPTSLWTMIASIFSLIVSSFKRK